MQVKIIIKWHYAKILRRAGLVLFLSFIPTLLASFAAANHKSSKNITPVNNPELLLTVLIANDPEFKEVSDTDAQVILHEAQKTVADKLSFAHLKFKIVGHTNVKNFLDTYAPDGNACVNNFEPLRVRPNIRSAQSIDQKYVINFLSHWKLEELKAFFPSNVQAELSSYEIIAQKLQAEHDKKIALLKNFKLANGASLLSEKHADERSYVRWICAMRKQNVADLILTNAFILYDLGSEPFPHTVFQKCKVGGAALQSPSRRAMRGRAMFSSTFSMFTEIPFFKEDGLDKLSHQERLNVIGAFILAHELGHAIFRLPDFYDHPKECLMTTKYETGYIDGYYLLKQHPGACPACAPWVKAREHVFKADQALANGDNSTAIAELKEAIRTTPKHIDGSYKRAMADLSFEIAKLSAQQNPQAALKWLNSVLKIVPNHSEALELQTELKEFSQRSQ
ncbi:MAG: hypothetical protein JW841_05965 [Deltaproteobacteria bacterium]|nr:hypothetical protein [Deltaproteobacteria bacterium]